MKKTKKENNAKQKCVRVALAGVPNAGKSTLINYLIGKKISIVSPKVQTTRDLIRGIIVQGNTQIIFIDTPGVFVPKKSRALERKIVKTAWSGIMDAEIVCLIVDATEGLNEKVKNIIDGLKQKQSKVALVLNKVDIIQKPKLLEITTKFTEYFPHFEEVFMISAKTGHGIEPLKKYLIAQAPEGEWVYTKDEITDAPLKFLASEITREKLFLKLHEELPYSADVETESWEKFKNGEVKIRQVIYVLKENQKKIILGRKGENIRKINIEARREISNMLRRKVHLFLFVKVKEDWVERKE